LKPVFTQKGNEDEIDLYDLRKKHVLLVAGIASPQPLVEKLEKKTYNLYSLFSPIITISAKMTLQPFSRN